MYSIVIIVQIIFFSDHGYYGEWGEWESPEKVTDETYKQIKTRQCRNKWSPNHEGVTCDPLESSEMSKTWTLEEECATNLEHSPDLTKYYKTFTSKDDKV